MKLTELIAKVFKAEQQPQVGRKPYLYMAWMLFPQHGAITPQLLIRKHYSDGSAAFVLLTEDECEYVLRVLKANHKPALSTKEKEQLHAS